MIILYTYHDFMNGFNCLPLVTFTNVVTNYHKIVIRVVAIIDVNHIMPNALQYQITIIISETNTGSYG